MNPAVAPLTALAFVILLSGCQGGPERASWSSWPELGYHLDSLAETPVGNPASSYFALEAANHSLVVFEKTAVNIFDSTGALQARLGRDGSGPNEFLLIARVGRVSDSLLWIWDTRLSRMTLLDLSLTALKPDTVTLRRFSQTGTSTRRYWNAVVARNRDGRSMMVGLRESVEPKNATGRPESRTVFGWNPSGEGFPVELGVLPPPSPECAIRGAKFNMDLPECRTRYWAISPYGDAIAAALPAGPDEPDTYRIVRFNTTGDTTLDSVYKLESGVFTPELRAAWLESKSRYMPPSAAFPKFKWPDRLAPVRGLVVGRDSSLWLKGSLEGALRIWHVLGSRGQQLGVTRIPDELWVHEAWQSSAIVTRDLENGQIVVYRLHLDVGS